MRAAILLAALFAVACGASPTEPEPCEPLPWCEAFEDDVVFDSLIPLPDSVP